MLPSRYVNAAEAVFNTPHSCLTTPCPAHCSPHKSVTNGCIGSILGSIQTYLFCCCYSFSTIAKWIVPISPPPRPGTPGCAGRGHSPGSPSSTHCPPRSQGKFNPRPCPDLLRPPLTTFLPPSPYHISSALPHPLAFPLTGVKYSCTVPPQPCPVRVEGGGQLVLSCEQCFILFQYFISLRLMLGA